MPALVLKSRSTSAGAGPGGASRESRGVSSWTYEADGMVTWVGTEVLVLEVVDSSSLVTPATACAEIAPRPPRKVPSSWPNT